MLVLSLISSSYLEAEILKNTNQSLFIAIVDYKFWFVGFFFLSWQTSDCEMKDFQII